MALALLARDWVQARRGGAIGLIVDHGLRPGSAAEAQRVAERCRALGLEAEVLTWNGPKPATRIEERAREARYALLRQACRRHGILHLLTGHHLDDQLETVAMREARGAGPIGLAGMPTERFFAEVRLLRPLLSFPRGRLEATVRAGGIEVERDPLNIDLRFARARLRLEGVDRDRLAEVAACAAAERSQREQQLAALAARAVAIRPLAWAELIHEPFAASRLELASLLLARLVTTIGGRAHPPRSARVLAAVARMRAGDLSALTLGGCLLRRRRQGWTICREPVAVRGTWILTAHGELLFDGRFRVRCEGPGGVEVMSVAEARRRGVTLVRPPRLREVPAAAWLTLPVAMADGRPVAAPPSYRPARGWRIQVSFAPLRRFIEAPFAPALFRAGEGLY